MKLGVNKQAKLNYEIVETFSAGIILEGFEVKSLRQQHLSLKGAYVTAHENEAFLVNAYIAPYQINNTPDWYDPYRKRKLLLKKGELVELQRQKRSSGLTVVPLSIYTTPHQKIKVELALVRGKKKHDKRQTLRERDDKRSMERTLKNR